MLPASAKQSATRITAAPARRYASRLLPPSNWATFEGRIRMPAPTIPLTAMAVRLSQPIARTGAGFAMVESVACVIMKDSACLLMPLLRRLRRSCGSITA